MQVLLIGSILQIAAAKKQGRLSRFYKSTLIYPGFLGESTQLIWSTHEPTMKDVRRRVQGDTELYCPKIAIQMVSYGFYFTPTV